MAQFYNKYRHLFEEDGKDMTYFKQGFDYSPQQPPQFQQANYYQQQQQYQQPQQLYNYQPQQQQQQQQKSYSPAPQENKYTSSRNSAPDKFRKQVVQDNIFQQQQQQSQYQQYAAKPQEQPKSYYTQNQSSQLAPQQSQTKVTQINDTPQKRKLANQESEPPAPKRVNANYQPQTYNVFQQEQDILDTYVQKPAEQKKIMVKSSPEFQEKNIHKIYTIRLNDLEYLKNRYVDSKQLIGQLDRSNPYKLALQNRVLAHLKLKDRRAELSKALEIK